MWPTVRPPLSRIPWKYRLASAVVALACLAIPPADAQSNTSRYHSEASVAVSAAVPLVVLSALGEGASFVVTGLAVSGTVVAVTVSAATAGASFVVYLSVETVKALGLSAGHALEAVAVSGGWLLMASGEAICFIADEATRTHIHSREITFLPLASPERIS